MAIFDNSMFDPQSFRGGMSGWLQQALQTGLLGKVLAQQQDQSTQQDQPMRPQIGPTFAAGDHGMMGGVPFPIAPGPEPQPPTALPPGAMPAGPAQMQSQMQPQAQPPLPQFTPFGPQGSPDIFSRLSAAAHNMGGKGIIPGLMDSIQGLATGQRLDPQGQQLQIMQAKWQALMSQPGMTPDKALAIIQDPALAAKYYTPMTVKPGEQLINPSDLNNNAAPAAPGTTAPGPKPAYQNNTGMMDDKTLSTLADQYIAGDKSVLQNLSRSTMGAMNLMALRTKIAQRMEQRGIKPEEQAARIGEFNGFLASQHALGNRSAQIDMAVTEANQLAPQVLATSNSINRTDYPDLNKILLAWKEKTGDPNIVKFSVALNSFINIYGRAINPTGVATVSDKEHAREILSQSWSKGQIQSGIEQLNKEMELAQKSPGMVKEQMRRQFTNSTGPQQQNNPDPLGIR